MDPHYRHTQVGWVILAVTAGLSLVLWLQMRSAHLPPGAWLPLAILGFVLLLFGTLRVEVGRDGVRAVFGLGLIRRTVAFRDVAAWRPVRNPWYVGWGIRAIPHGTLWNVSGLDAVELVLKDGRRFRIGTDEPEPLARAIETSLGFPASGPDAVLPAPAPRGRLLPYVVGATIVVGVVLALLPFVFQTRPPGVRVSSSGLEVETPFYGQTYPADEIVAISLEARLPRILARTNGFAGAGTLRGHFRVEGLGDGKLFVDLGCAPYVLLRLRRGFVIVNFREPERTQALYDELARAFPDRVDQRAE